MENKNVIAVDIDATLHEFPHTAAIVALNEFGIRTERPVTEWGRLLYPITCPEQEQEIFDLCHSRDYIFLTRPYNNVSMYLKAIESYGYTIRYYTDRKESSLSDTIEWLDAYDFPASEDVICCTDKRVELLKHKESLVSIFDDRPRTLFFGIHTLGFKNVFSIKHDYNRSLVDLPCVHLFDDWDLLHEKFFTLHTAGEIGRG